MSDVQSVARLNVFIIFTHAHLISKIKKGKDQRGGNTYDNVCNAVFRLFGYRFLTSYYLRRFSTTMKKR